MRKKYSKEEERRFLKRVHVDTPFNVFEEMPDLEFVLACIPILNPKSDEHFIYPDNLYTKYDEQNNKIGVYCTHDIEEPMYPMYGMELKTNKGKTYTSLFFQRSFGEIALDPKYKDNIEGSLVAIFIHSLTDIKKNLDKCINALECPKAKDDVLKERENIVSFLDNAIKTLEESNI